jgi:hypothetical protein
LLELFGSGYVIDHCVSAFLEKQRKKAYQVYVTDALKAIAENSAGGSHRSTMTRRWIDLVEKQKTKETRSAEDIISDFKNRLNKGGETE